MPIPKEILAVARPKNTVVKKSGKRYLVIKRTCKRKDGRNIPVDLGTVGEILNGEYIQIREQPRKKTVDIKDYGEVAICNKQAYGLLQSLANIWDIDEAKKLYVMSVLRSAYGDIKNRDLKMYYDTSYLSEIYPGVSLSKNTISKFLEDIGKSYACVCDFMRDRVLEYEGKPIIVDGMLKDYNSHEGSLSEFSRKGAKKGSKDISILYAFDPENKEPIASKVYQGNMLDQTAIKSFVSDFKIKKGMMIFDKGFYSEEFLEDMNKEQGLSYLIPLKQSSKIITNYKMNHPVKKLKLDKDTYVLYKKVRMSSGKYLYSFRDPRIAYEQEMVYLKRTENKGTFDETKYEEKKSLFGLIVFKSKSNLSPELIYQAYQGRWEIETMFNFYKNIMERETVDVTGDYRVYATEFINFLSVIISTRVKNLFRKTGLSAKYSHKQIFTYLGKYKKCKLDGEKKWRSSELLKYIQEITKTLAI